MTIDLDVLARRLDPRKTILLFGAGSSIPSGAPSTPALVGQLSDIFKVNMQDQLSLSDISTIIQHKHDRRALVEAISGILSALQPTRGLLNLPDFDWAGLYTTNYDDLIEKAYSRAKRNLQVVCSNFDFTSSTNMSDDVLYKLHGSIGQDMSLGHRHRMIVSAQDYDFTNEYRDILYAKFSEQLLTCEVLVIGNSLSDPDLRTLVDKSAQLKRSAGAPGRITLFAYQEDENQAIVYESRGLDVCFGGVDDFFHKMTNRLAPTALLPGITDNPLDRARSLHPSTTVVADARTAQAGDLSRMFNGAPASYADIMRGWTFERDFSGRLESQMANRDGKRIAYVLGAAGFGKSTGIRKALSGLVDRGILCWEHVSDLSFQSESWTLVDDELRKRSEAAVLFVDDAHEHLHELNSLVDAICANDSSALKLILASSRPNWNPRLKSPNIFSSGVSYELERLSAAEINSLLDILETSSDIAALVESSFLGFSRPERRRRLSERCQSDMFVCMKNIFASESIDHIILREYAELGPDYQEIYKNISGMEAAGVRVHRQLVLRALGVPAQQVSRYLDDLKGIIEERTISEKGGIFSWKVRHGVIADIVARYKFSGEEEFYEFLDRTIDHLNPTYPIEVLAINEMCDPRRGFARIYDKRKQNVLLRKMISLAPRERVPRHRLITNLIAIGDYENASTEIRIFENELRSDGPVQRYKVRLMIEKARRIPGILEEDRAAMIREAASVAVAGISRFPDDKNLYRAYLDAGVAYLRYVPDREIFDQAMEMAKLAYDRILDPELARTIRRYEVVEQRFTV